MYIINHTFLDKQQIKHTFYVYRKKAYFFYTYEIQHTYSIRINSILVLGNVEYKSYFFHT